MQHEPLFSDVLVKTIKNSAKTLKKSSGLSYTESLNLISREYGFDDWQNVLKLKNYIILIFTVNDSKDTNSDVYNNLIEREFYKIDPNAKIGNFSINQRFPPLQAHPLQRSSKNDFFQDWKFDVFRRKKDKQLGNLTDIRHLMEVELRLQDFCFVVDGQLYSQDSFVEDDAMPDPFWLSSSDL